MMLTMVNLMKTNDYENEIYDNNDNIDDDNDDDH